MKRFLKMFYEWTKIKDQMQFFLGSCRGASFFTGLTWVKGPANSVHLLVIPFLAISLRPAVLAISAVVLCTVAGADSGSAQLFTVAAQQGEANETGCKH
jgi:hypothetical protein